MLCSRCKKREAKIYYTEFINGQKKEEYLCEECAAQYTSFQEGAQSLGNFLSSILSSYYGEQMGSQAKESKELSCPVCSMKLSELMGTGKAGCANCYQFFGKTLNKAIRQLQGADIHKGKRPKHIAEETGKASDALSQAEKLGILLQEAVEKEEFEEAARLRDEIRALKKAEEENIEAAGRNQELKKEEALNREA